MTDEQKARDEFAAMCRTPLDQIQPEILNIFSKLAAVDVPFLLELIAKERQTVENFFIEAKRCLERENDDR